MTWSPQPLTHWTATSLRKLLRELAGTLPDVLGLDEAAGFISVVGQHIGNQINIGCRRNLTGPVLSRSQVAPAWVDLKRRTERDLPN